MLSPSTENSHDLRSHRNTQFIYQSFKNTINTRGMWGNQRIQSMSFSNMELSRKRNKSKQKQTNTFTPSGTGGKKWTEPSTLPTVAWTAFFLVFSVICCCLSHSRRIPSRQLRAPLQAVMAISTCHYFIL